MSDDRRQKGSPFDEGKLRLVREFLQREFRDCRHDDCRHDDYVDPAKTAQVFIIEPSCGPRHMLIVPTGTFEHAAFPFLFNANLADALQLAGGVPLTLTAQ